MFVGFRGSLIAADETDTGGADLITLALRTTHADALLVFKLDSRCRIQDAGCRMQGVWVRRKGNCEGSIPFAIILPEAEPT
jgi:hypothetical protein